MYETNAKEHRSIEQMIAMRIANQEDMRFVFGSWLKSYRNEFQNKIIPRRVYYPSEASAIQALVDCKNTKTIVSYNVDESNQVFGWCCFTDIDGESFLHYAFVKTMFRNMGIFKRMIHVIVPRLGFEDIITTRISRDLLNYRILEKYKMVYNPYIESKVKELG